MMTTLRNWLTPPAPKKPIRRQVRTRLGVEPLEDRTVPTTFYVTNTLDDNNTGSLRRAINDANGSAGNDDINFDFNKLPSTAVMSLTSSLPTITGNVTIKIFNPISNVFQIQSNAIRSFTVNAGVSATIYGLNIITANFTPGSGGTIQNFGNLTVENCSLYSGANGEGGAIFNQGALVVGHSRFLNCSAQGGSGGAISTGGGGSAIVYNSYFTGNGASFFGGAIDANSSSLRVANCTFVGNGAKLGGSASGGGTISTFGTGTKVVNNSIFGGNLTGGTFGNFANGGVADDLSFYSGGGSNNLVCSAPTSGGFVNGTNGNVVGVNGSGNRDFNTVLAAPANNGGMFPTRLPLANGGAVNAGSNSLAVDEFNVALIYDDRSIASQLRIQGGRVDIGSAESSVKGNSTSNLTGPTTLNGGQAGAYLAVVADASLGSTTPTGTVTFFVDGASNATLDLSGGAVSFNSPTNLAAGPHTIQATYNGNADFNSSTSSTITVTVGSSSTTPQSFVVDTLSDVDDNVTTAGNLSLREAIRISNGNNTPATNDKITFASSLNNGTISLLSALPTIAGNLSITGLGQNSFTVARPASAATGFRIFTIGTGATVGISNLTVAGGNVTDSSGGAGSFGGGIRSDGNLAVTRVTVRNNSDVRGAAGIASYAGTLNVSLSTIRDNGGIGVAALAGVTANILSSTISGNTDTLGIGGAGVFNGSTTMIINCTIAGNTTVGSGGGILNISTLTVINSTIALNGADSGNHMAGVGGGIFPSFGLATTLYNTIVAGNFLGATDINASTVKSNDIDGGNVAAASSNNLISEPTAAGGLVNGVKGNLVGTAGQTTDITTVIQLAIDPVTNNLLNTLADNGGNGLTYSLVFNSLALAAGSATVPGFVALDERNVTRDQGPPDIGAYEVQHPLAPVGVVPTFNELFSPKPSANPTIAFVKGMYQSTLNRSPSDGEIQGNLAALAAGNSKAALCYGFINSPENRTNQVTFFYKYFLGRFPDAGGLAVHVNNLLGGNDEGTEMIGFILSPEFSGLNDNSSFVNLMYYALLSRQSDPTGFANHIRFLNGGGSRATIVDSFLRSPEGIARLLNNYTATYLKRPVGAEVGTYSASLINKTTTFGRVASQILASDEFFADAANNL